MKNNTWRNLIISPPKKVIPKPKELVTKKDSAFHSVKKYLAYQEGTECNLQVRKLYPPGFFKRPFAFLEHEDFVNRPKNWKATMQCKHGKGVCGECVKQERTGKTIFHRHHNQALCSECVKGGHYMIVDSDLKFK